MIYQCNNARNFVNLFDIYVIKKDISKNTLDTFFFSPELQKEVLLLEEESKQELEKFLLRLKNVKKMLLKL